MPEKLKSPMDVKTRAQAEAWVKQDGRICRGPLLLPKVLIDNYTEHLNNAINKKDVDAMNQISNELLKSHSKLHKYPHDAIHQLEDAQIKAVSILFARKDDFIRGNFVKEDGKPGGCGADLNPEIAGLPFDGEYYNISCPKCNTEQLIKTAVFPNLSEAEREAK
jgi:hypothetical protein